MLDCIEFSENIFVLGCGVVCVSLLRIHRCVVAAQLKFTYAGLERHCGLIWSVDLQIKLISGSKGCSPKNLWDFFISCLPEVFWLR